jgi:deoxyribonuclease V
VRLAEELKRLSQAWPRTPAEARALQDRLRARVIAEDRLGHVRLVAGADAHYPSGRAEAWGVVALLELPELALRDWAKAVRPTDFPYVSGLLSFREAPAILAALARLPEAPDLLLVDGQGRAHPRRFGLACHIGVLADLPTIGVAKSRLIGDFDPPGAERGAWSPLRIGREVVGAALTTRSGTRPVFVSVGHRLSLETAIDVVLRCAPRLRIPEPIRQADRLSRLASAEAGPLIAAGKD